MANKRDIAAWRFQPHERCSSLYSFAAMTLTTVREVAGRLIEAMLTAHGHGEAVNRAQWIRRCADDEGLHEETLIKAVKRHELFPSLKVLSHGNRLLSDVEELMSVSVLVSLDRMKKAPTRARCSSRCGIANSRLTS